MLRSLKRFLMFSFQLLLCEIQNCVYWRMIDKITIFGLPSTFLIPFSFFFKMCEKSFKNKLTIPIFVGTFFLTFSYYSIFGELCCGYFMNWTVMDLIHQISSGKCFSIRSIGIFCLKLLKFEAQHFKSRIKCRE